MMGVLKGEFFPIKILNKNSLSLAHCVLNRSFTISQFIESNKNLNLQ